MDNETRRLAFELGPGEQVTLLLNGARHVLGTKVDVCRRMERFLTEVGHSFEQRFLGQTIEQWDGRWTEARPLTGGFTDFRRSVGLYRAVLD